MTTLELVKSEETPVTPESLAAIEFAAVKEFRGHNQKQRLTKSHRIVDRVRPQAAVSVEVLAKSKEELIRLVTERPELWMETEEMLSRAVVDAKTILELIQSAHIRILCAFENLVAEYRATGSER